MREPGNGEVQALDTLLDSTLESVDTAEEAVLKIAGEMGFAEEELHRIGIAVRETVVNAVVHGNRYNIRKKVHLRVSQGDRRLVIEVQDEGDGFEMARVPDPLADENLLRHSGRGILLMHAFMDEFQMRPALPKGAEVRMVKYLSKAN
ncbi:MAG: ATP-binding protein [Bryobacteraceae bacterium]